MVKINMGCGKRNFGKDWIHIDAEKYDHVTWYSITDLYLNDNTVDLIYASHVINYFDRNQVVGVLSEWKRVLKPGGVLRLAVPDFYQIAQLYYMNFYKLNYLDQLIGPLYGRMFCDGRPIYHKTTYDFTALHDLLEYCGFKNIDHWDWRKTEHAQFDDHSQAYLPHMDKENGVLISLNIQCEK